MKQLFLSINILFISFFIYGQVTFSSSNAEIIESTKFSTSNNPILVGEHLLYTIRFQNTGNFMATDVIIRDTLDDSLNPNTLSVINSSHPNILETKMENGKYLSFNFEGIMLPDSTSNLEASQGFITY